MEKLETWIKRLGECPEGTLFNPWYESDRLNDTSDQAPLIRRRQLSCYLKERLETARYLFIAEALGYQGGHFTGIAMTSERILLGYQQQKYGVRPEHVFRSVDPRRTSRTEVKQNGMSEPTATIMWSSLVNLGIDPYQVVLWNAVPWHPYKSTQDILSNRTPTPSELDAGLEILEEFLKLFPGCGVVAVGRKCEGALQRLGVSHNSVRHPANGGAPTFRKQLEKLFDGVHS